MYWAWSFVSLKESMSHQPVPVFIFGTQFHNFLRHIGSYFTRQRLSRGRLASWHIITCRNFMVNDHCSFMCHCSTLTLSLDSSPSTLLQWCRQMTKRLSHFPCDCITASIAAIFVCGCVWTARSMFACEYVCARKCVRPCLFSLTGSITCSIVEQMGL